MPLVEIDLITVGSNRRALKGEKVTELMASIQANGLINPITLDEKRNLVAGLHRLTAYKLLGYKQIECKIITYEDPDRTRLAEIDENLIRSELDALERGELWLERDQILERLGLRARVGDNQYTQKGRETVSPPLTKTTLELAKEAGYTERTYQHGKQIAKSIAPEVKEVIKGTPVAKSPSALLKIARAGSKEHQKAKQAEKAAQEAKRRQEQEEAQRQVKLAAEAKHRQKELQLIALQSATAQKEAKLAAKKVQQQELEKLTNSFGQPRVQVGDEWMLDRHLIYCGNTSSNEFIDRLPSDAALAIATLSSTWNHDYLVNEAHVVAVLCSEGYIHEFCSQHQMPFRFELILGDIYIAIFSHQSISKPQRPTGLTGVEGIVAYLVSLYTKPSNFVIAPSLGQGEVLMACEKMGRICFAGEENPELVDRAIARWQKWAGRQAEKTLPN